MTNFAIDLWNDLRAKRLWPVAALLLAGLVATPVVLSKDAETPTPAPAAPVADQGEAKQTEGPAQLAEVKLEEAAKGSGSSLSSFDPRNPFAPPRRAIAAARDDVEASTAPSTATSPQVSSDPGSGGPTGDALKGVDVAPGGGVSVPPSVGGYTPPPTETGDDKPETKAPAYTYVVDVTFRANDRARTVKGLRKLDMLPGEESPLLIFMGVTEKAGNAVFMVDSTLQAAGEGTCKPSPDDCASLYLGPGSEHEFSTDDGDSYMLRVDEIRRVKVGARASASKRTKALASAALRRNVRALDSVPPRLAEVVKMSKDEESDSISDGDRR